MHKKSLTYAVVVVAFLAAGCGSNSDTNSSSDAADQSTVNVDDLVATIIEDNPVVCASGVEAAAAEIAAREPDFKISNNELLPIMKKACADTEESGTTGKVEEDQGVTEDAPVANRVDDISPAWKKSGMTEGEAFDLSLSFVWSDLGSQYGGEEKFRKDVCAERNNDAEMGKLFDALRKMFHDDGEPFFQGRAEAFIADQCN